MDTAPKNGRVPEVAKEHLETVKRLAATLGEITEKSHHLINQYLENTEADDGFENHAPGYREQGLPGHGDQGVGTPG